MFDYEILCPVQGQVSQAGSHRGLLARQEENLSRFCRPGATLDSRWLPHRAHPVGELVPGALPSRVYGLVTLQLHVALCSPTPAHPQTLQREQAFHLWALQVPPPTRSPPSLCSFGGRETHVLLSEGW